MGAPREQRRSAREPLRARGLQRGFPVQGHEPGKHTSNRVRLVPWEPQGAAQERQRTPESPRGLQRGFPRRGHELGNLTPVTGKGCAARKETKTETKTKTKTQ